ncbi:putative nickel ion binding protein [Thermochaetoides thermophila DSM 1495]|uniref:Putative nickel ion binding protein n=1 Tax=Chaetomium thermophilum (strain DSM 1495 / CBS 144.50 / IMI 039719) TaxID=759272 RepID=G0SDT5_CHATD|nr:putative nickel ion binding protein [Thermochaetoides thermophila DSM 1495]EGS18686.1 putative nickel ion binding protein [Thermochaetoides thermophila DSM 1495]
MNSPFPKSSSSPGKGRIVVRLGPDGSTSRLETCTYQYPLKLITPMRPSQTKSALVFLLSYGGGLVAGDTVNLSIDIQPGARLSVVTQGHTKIFKSPTPDVVTRQTLTAEIASSAALCLLPDPVQPFEGSVYEQLQVFKVARGGSLCLLDWVTQGRAARGEHWSFVRWTGKNEVWMVDGDGSDGERLLVRDSVILDCKQVHSQIPALRDAMHGMGVVGTLILRGPLMKPLGEFFLAEFAALPRLGARDWRSEEAKKAEEEKMSPHERWRAERIQCEKENKLLWSAASVRGCVVVKFGSPEVEASQRWLGSMLAKEGSIARHFDEQAMMCLRCH